VAKRGGDRRSAPGRRAVDCLSEGIRGRRAASVGPRILTDAVAVTRRRCSCSGRTRASRVVAVSLPAGCSCPVSRFPQPDGLRHGQPTPAGCRAGAYRRRTPRRCALSRRRRISPRPKSQMPDRCDRGRGGSSTGAVAAEAPRSIRRYELPKKGGGRASVAVGAVSRIFICVVLHPNPPGIDPSGL